MNKIFYIILFFSNHLFSQTERITDFYPLTPIDTIYNFKEIKISERIDSLNNNDFFFTYRDKKYQSGLLLKKREKDKWIVYDFESDLLNSPNTTIKGFSKENDKLISIQVSGFPSGACSNIYGVLIILNIKTCKTTEFWNYNYTECYNEFGEVASKSECKATIDINDNLIKISSTKKPNDGLYCVESSEYKIEDNKLIKTKYFFDRTQTLYPIICVENICTGMNFNAAKKEFPDATFEEAPLYKYGSDSNKLGFEICVKGEVILFVIVSDDLIVGITVVSPKYNFDGIDTNTTLSEVLEKYPNSKIYVDLISDWEYITLIDKRIRLEFKTNNTNRIGIYDFDPEHAANGIKRKDAKIDLIHTF